MKRIAIVLGVGWLAATGACGALWAKGSLSTPQEDAHHRDFPRGNCFTGSILQREARADEARRLAAYPAVAHRDGNRLTLTFPGHTPIVMTDDVPRCTSTIFSGTPDLHDARTGEAEPGFVVTGHFGEFENQSLYTPTGQSVIAWSIWPAPGGRRVATAFSYGLGLIDWPDLDAMTVLTPHCDTLAWRDERHFTATCAIYGKDGSGSPFLAAGTRDPDGVWHLQATAWQDATLKNALPSFTAQSFDRKAGQFGQ